MRALMRSTTLLIAVVIALAALGCGGGGGGEAFDDCGNGVLDGGEACDDGNQDDGDACLATCEANVCGDGLRNAAAEECDGIVPGRNDCDSIQLGSGLLRCGADCRVDTSGCSGSGGTTPTPNGTPVISPTSVPTGDETPVPTPTPTLTPGGGTGCSGGEAIVVAAAVDRDYGAVRLDLGYPAGVNLPGSGTAESVADRVTFASTNGLTTVNDDDNTGTVTTSLVSFTQQPAGPFVTITFDCIAGNAAPSAADFTCTVVSASDAGGTAITDVGCAITVH